MFRQLLVAFLFSGIAVSFVVLFTQSFRMLSFVIDNSSTIAVFLKLMVLMIPTFLPLILPISMGAAVLFIYHKLAVDSEMVVLRAAGLSPMRLAAPALTLAGLVVVFGLALTMWFAPASNASLVSLQYKVRDEYSAFMIRPGAFNDLAEGLTFYARKRGSNGGLEDILIHDVRVPEKPVTTMAKNGLFSVENGVPQIVVFHGKRQEVDRASGRLQQLNFDRYVLDLDLLKSTNKSRLPEPREMTLPQLVRAQQDPTLVGKAYVKTRTEIHQRIGGPLLALTFATIGFTVILVGEFNRRGMMRRVLFGTLLIVVVQAAMFGLVSQVSKGGWSIVLFYLVILAPIPPCLYLLTRRTPCAWPSLHNIGFFKKGQA